MTKAKVIKKEFKGNTVVSISEHEVRVWVCDLKTGANIFRFKATGKVYHNGSDVTVFAKETL